MCGLSTRTQCGNRNCMHFTCLRCLEVRIPGWTRKTCVCCACDTNPRLDEVAAMAEMPHGVDAQTQHVSAQARRDVTDLQVDSFEPAEMRTLHVPADGGPVVSKTEGSDQRHSEMFERSKGVVFSLPSLPFLNPVATGLESHIADFFSYDKTCGGAAESSWPELIQGAYPELRSFSLVHQLSQLVLRNLEIRRLAVHLGFVLLSFTEHWAGGGELTLQHLLVGFVCARFDKLYSDTHDCETAAGLRLWLDSLTYTEESALNWFGTQCSSFLVCCMKHSKRKPSNGYAGDEKRAFVVSGNHQKDVVSLMYFLSFMFGNEPFLEQPLNSVLPKMRPLRTVFEWAGVTRTVTALGAYGAPTVKRLQLWHCHSVYKALKARVPKSSRPKASLTRVVVRKDGKRAFTGKKKEMKDSQAYPPAFAFAVARLSRTRSNVD